MIKNVAGWGWLFLDILIYADVIFMFISAIATRTWPR